MPPVKACTALVAVTSLLWLVASSGCSLFVERAPPRRAWPKHRPFGAPIAECTTSPAAPIVDATVALAFTALAINATRRDGDGGLWLPIMVGLPLLPFAGAASYGFWQTARCREYRTMMGPRAW